MDADAEPPTAASGFILEVAAATSALPPAAAAAAADATAEEEAGTTLPTPSIPSVPVVPSPTAWALPPRSTTGTGVLALPREPNPEGLPLMQRVIIVYRISSGGYAHKVKPPFVAKESCLLNFISALVAFVQQQPTLHIRLVLVKDCVDCGLEAFIAAALTRVLRKAAPSVVIEEHSTSFGNGAASFRHGLDVIKKLVTSAADAETTGIYCVEDDYLHTKHALTPIFGALALAPYVTGYAHPDKCFDSSAGGNPLIVGGGEVTRLFSGLDRHWCSTNSTTMTFASSALVLAEDEATLRMFTSGRHPDDFHMFLALGATRGRLLISPLPAVATHGETAYLARFVDWERLGAQAMEYVSTLRSALAATASTAPTAPTASTASTASTAAAGEPTRAAASGKKKKHKTAST